LAKTPWPVGHCLAFWQVAVSRVAAAPVDPKSYTFASRLHASGQLLNRHGGTDGLMLHKSDYSDDMGALG